MGKRKYPCNVPIAIFVQLDVIQLKSGGGKLKSPSVNFNPANEREECFNWI